jgi:hypothetical protein
MPDHTDDQPTTPADFESTADLAHHLQSNGFTKPPTKANDHQATDQRESERSRR